MLHLLKYRFKTLLNDKTTLFWTLVFPIILSTLFGLTLKDAFNPETIDLVPVSVVINEQLEDSFFKSFMDALDGEILDVRYDTIETSNPLLENSDIKGIIVYNNQDLELVVKSSGIQQTMIKSIMDTYLQKSKMIENLLIQGVNPQQLMDTLQIDTNYVDDKSQDNTQLSSVFFYTVIAMCSLMGGTWAMRCIVDTNANLSSQGARINVAPTKKSHVILVNLIASNIVQYCITLTLLAYLIFILKIDFGTQILHILLICLLSSMTGNALGCIVGVYGKQDISTKTGLLTGITMLFSFLSGMMMVQVKYIVQTIAPILSYINPANMITDAFYALYYYGGGERFYFNIISMILFSTILYTISFIVLRRKQYASI